MEDKIYAFIAEGDVFGTMSVPGSSKIAERYYAGFSSNAQVVECTSYTEVTIGWTWDGEKFLPPAETLSSLNVNSRS